MTTGEKLQKIRARCVELIALAEKWTTEDERCKTPVQCGRKHIALVNFYKCGSTEFIDHMEDAVIAAWSISNETAHSPTPMRLNDIGREAHEINAANGWETFRPQDWNAETSDAEKVAAWIFEPAHRVTDNENQDGSPLPDYSRVIARCKATGKIIFGTGTNADEALAHAHLNVITASETLKLCTHMALVHSEVSEATEAIRHRDRENFDEELADVVIRVASIAHGLGTDLEAVVAAKLAKNRTRGLHHGGKAV